MMVGLIFNGGLGIVVCALSALAVLSGGNGLYILTAFLFSAIDFFAGFVLWKKRKRLYGRGAPPALFGQVLTFFGPLSEGVLVEAWALDNDGLLLLFKMVIVPYALTTVYRLITEFRHIAYLSRCNAVMENIVSTDKEIFFPVGAFPCVAAEVASEETEETIFTPLFHRQADLLAWITQFSAMMLEERSEKVSEIKILAFEHGPYHRKIDTVEAFMRDRVRRKMSPFDWSEESTL